ncbi:MAG: transcriptional regulator [Actinomycetia bacterium]|nr:transcriptional regulator [Actinomycetes bacterium]
MNWWSETCEVPLSPSPVRGVSAGTSRIRHCDGVRRGRGPPYQPVVSYPPYGVATLPESAPAPPPDALAALLGRNRAALLIALGSPAATTELARRLEVTPGAVSQHLGVLRACGLVVGHRVGRRVLYVRTDAGDALTEGAAG